MTQIVFQIDNDLVALSINQKKHRYPIRELKNKLIKAAQNEENILESVQRKTMMTSAVRGVGEFDSETKFSEDRSRDSKLKSFNAGQPSQMSTGSKSDDSSKTSSSDNASDSEESHFAEKKNETVGQKSQSSSDSSDTSEGKKRRRKDIIFLNYTFLL